MQHRHQQNDSCIKMGSDETQFSVLLIVRGTVTETVSTNHNFYRGRRTKGGWNRGPSAYQPSASPLGQTGSPVDSRSTVLYFLSVWRGYWAECLQSTPAKNDTHVGHVYFGLFG